MWTHIHNFFYLQIVVISAKKYSRHPENPYLQLDLILCTDIPLGGFSKSAISSGVGRKTEQKSKLEDWKETPSQIPWTENIHENFIWSESGIRISCTSWEDITTYNFNMFISSKTNLSINQNLPDLMKFVLKKYSPELTLIITRLFQFFYIAVIFPDDDK